MKDNGECIDNSNAVKIQWQSARQSDGYPDMKLVNRVVNDFGVDESKLYPNS